MGQTHTLKGKVVDAKNNEGIASVSIQLIDTKISTTTDSLGFFDFQVPEQSEYNLRVSHVSFINQDISVRANDSALIQMQVDNLLLQQVDVSGQTNDLPKNGLQKN